METISGNYSQEDYSKAYIKYQEICWKIDLEDYDNESELKKLIQQKEKLKEKWEFEELCIDDEDA